VSVAPTEQKPASQRAIYSSLMIEQVIVSKAVDRADIGGFFASYTLDSSA